MIKKGSYIVICMMLISAVAIFIQLLFTATLAQKTLKMVSHWAMIEIAISFSLALCVLGTEATLTSLTASRAESKFGSVFVAYMLVVLVVFMAIGAPFFFSAFYFFLEIPWKSTLQVIFAVGVVTLMNVAAMLLRANKCYLQASLLEKTHWWGLGCAAILFGLTSEAFSVSVFELFFYVSLAVTAVLTGTVLRVVTSFELNLQDIFRCIRQVLRGPSTFFLSLNGIVVALYERLDQIILSKMLGAEALAIYFICFKLSFVVRFMTKSINQFFLPLLARTNAQTGQVSAVSMINKNIKIGSRLALPVVMLSILCSSLFLEQFGVEDPSATLTAQILVISGFFSIANLVVFGFFGAHQGGDLVLSNGVMSLIGQLVLLVLLIPSLNLFAPAIARIGAVSIGNINAHRYAKKKGMKVDLLSNSALGVLMLSALIAFNIIW